MEEALMDGPPPSISARSEYLGGAAPDRFLLGRFSRLVAAPACAGADVLAADDGLQCLVGELDQTRRIFGKQRALFGTQLCPEFGIFPGPDDVVLFHLDLLSQRLVP